MSVRCLLVDDSRTFLAAARTLLEREGLVIVGVATTSAEAVRDMRVLRPDVVLVDVSLGEESGLDLAERLVADPANHATVILISSRSATEFEDVIATSPVTGFLSKSELSARAVHGLLEAT